jgi:DNA (cytosine-5)-methyltransferase 1
MLSNGLRAVSLFSGAGGLDVGFERAGYETVWANEFDHDAATAWRENRPHNATRMIEGDINEHLGDLEAFAGEVDVLFGGPPCQGFSVAGKMDPNDERSELVWSFIKAVEIVRPKVFVIENVAALARLSKWKGVRDGIVSRAKEIGYETTYRVHLASDYGVPENRERVFFIGVRSGCDDPNKVYEALEAYKREPEPLRSVLSSVGTYGSDENPQTCTARISLAKAPVMRRSPYAGMLVNGAGRPMNLDGCAPTLPASMGGNKTPIVDQRSLDSGCENWFVGYHQRLESGAASPERESVPPYIRRLTLAEAAAIQTFPHGYVFSGKKTKQYKQIGNAVPCGLAEAVANAVYDCFFKSEVRS